MKESYTLFGLEKGKKISRNSLFKRYMQKLSENPENTAIITEAYQDILGSDIITYPPVQAQDLVSYVNKSKQVNIPAWFNKEQDSREKARNLMDSINLLLARPSLLIEDLTIIFRLTNVLELEIKNISNPIVRDYFIAYLKSVDNNLKNNYHINEDKNIVFKSYKGRSK